MELHIVSTYYLTTINFIIIDEDLGLYQDEDSGDRITLLADGEHVAVCPQ